MSINGFLLLWQRLTKAQRIALLVWGILLTLSVLESAGKPDYSFAILLSQIIGSAAIVAAFYYAAQRGKTGLVLVWLATIGSLGYLLPWGIAYSRKHPNAAGIFAVNLLLGWTVVGWILALAWAVRTLQPVKNQPQPQAIQSPQPQVVHIYHHAVPEPTASTECPQCGAPGKLLDQPCRYCKR
jgi:hypothetical protein